MPAYPMPTKPKGTPVSELEREHKRRTMWFKGKDPEIIVRLAREQTEEALRILVTVMKDLEQPGAVRVRAIELLLDRGWGKTPQQIFLTDPTGQIGMGAIPILDRIAGLKAALGVGETIDLESSELVDVPAIPENAKKIGEDFI